MKGAVLYGAGDVRFEERGDPRIIEPTDAILRLSATCVCGSDLWPFRGIGAPDQPTPMGHEYCGIVEEVGRGTRVGRSLTLQSRERPRGVLAHERLRIVE